MRAEVGRSTGQPGNSPMDQARTYALDVLSHEKSAERLARVLKRIDTLADHQLEQLRKTPEGRVECKAGCDHCCHRVVGVGVAEMVRIAGHVRASMSEEEISGLVARSTLYEEQTHPFRDNRLHLARPTCPFLVNQRCAIYEHRPLACRGWNSRSAKACEAKRMHPETAPPPPMDIRQNGVVHGLASAFQVALSELSLSHDSVDLGAAIGDLLRHPERADAFMTGDRILLEHALIAPGPDPVMEQAKRASGSKEPSGHPSAKPAPGHPVYEFLRLSTPLAYANQSEIQSALRRYSRMVEDFADQNLDPAEAFNGLKEFQTFGLPYSGEDVTDLLKRVGETVVFPTVARALPDLVRPIEAKRREGKLRVGYLSINLRNQNGAKWALGWLANHADDFETYAICTGPWQDETSLDFRRAADHYYHVPGDVPSTARFIKSLDLDALIFPDIGNFGTNFQFASMRLAPVQCTGWGQPVTSGLPTIDYYLSSVLMEPENGQDHYSEKLILLPGSGLFIPRSAPAPSQLTRTDFGIPEGLVYLVAQNPRKLTPQWDLLFCEIQERTGGAFVFVDFNVPECTEPTKKRLADAGLRSTWLPPLKQADFWRVEQLCDVSLDPPSWHGGNTTLQAVGLGRPLVSLRGEFMRSRHSLAFLRQAGMGDLVATDAAEYVALACDVQRLNEIVSKGTPEGVFEDGAVPVALDQFLREAIKQARGPI